MVKVNGYPIRSFIDTGSTLSIISRQMADKLNLIVSGPRIKVEQVAGSGYSIGTTTANVNIGKITKEVVLHVFDRKNQDLFLGSKETALFSLTIECLTRTVRQKKRPKRRFGKLT